MRLGVMRAQQVTPESLVQIMQDLRIRRRTTDEEAFQSTLQQLRAQIDILDEQLLDILKSVWKLLTI